MRPRCRAEYVEPANAIPLADRRNSGAVQRDGWVHGSEFSAWVACRASGVVRVVIAVSKSVQQLETSFGLALFTRTTRSLTLTSEGADMYERALRLLQGVEEIQQAAVAARGEPAGIIKVTAPLPIGVNLLAPALPRFRERYPKLSVDLRLGDRITDLIEEGIDVAVRVGHVADSRLISRRLAPHRLCAFASPAYLAKHGTPRHPEDLAAHECVNFRYQSSGQTLRWPFHVGERVLEILPDAGMPESVSK